MEKLLKAVLGMKTVSKSKVDDVLFLSESETEKKSDHSENEKMQSDAYKTPEPKITSCDVLENEGGDRSESNVPRLQMAAGNLKTQMNQNPLQTCYSTLMKMI